MRDRRGREEQERRRRVAVDLVEDAHAVALDVALLVRVAGARLLARSRDDAHASRSARTSRRSRLNDDGSRACGKCPEPSSVTSSPPVASASAAPAACACDRVVVAVHDEHRAAHAPRELPRLARAPASRRGARRCSVSGVVSSPQPTQSSICFVECGSGKQLPEEELEEAAVVAQPVVAGCTSPSPRRCRARSSKGIDALGERLPPPDYAGPMKTAPATRSGCSAARISAARSAASEYADDDGALGRRSRRARRARPARTRARRTPRTRLGRSERPLPRPSNVTTR